MESPFRPEHFRRDDESDDRRFYELPRLVVHIDEHAIEAVRRLYAELLPPEGVVLDLMSSWRSHMPNPPPRRLVGLGLNEVELRENDQLDESVVHDVNRHPRLPFADESFDAVVMAVSAQYLTRPIEVFQEVNRILRAGGPFIVTYSNRMFPTKAVHIWKALDDAQRARLIAAYFHYAGNYGESTALDRSPRVGIYSDPLYAVYARKIDQGSETTT